MVGCKYKTRYARGSRQYNRAHRASNTYLLRLPYRCNPSNPVIRSSTIHWTCYPAEIVFAIWLVFIKRSRCVQLSSAFYYSARVWPRPALQRLCDSEHVITSYSVADCLATPSGVDASGTFIPSLCSERGHTNVRHTIGTL